MNVYEFVIKSHSDDPNDGSYFSTGYTVEEAMSKLDTFYGDEFKSTKFSEIIITPVEKFILRTL